MKGQGRALIVTLVLAAVVACLGAWAAAHYFLDARRSPSLHEYVHHELNLSPDQDRRLDALEADFAAKRVALEAEMRSANAELAAAFQVRHEYSPEVQQAVDHFHHSMGALQKETILHVLAMRQVLTPAQAAKFDKRIGEALTEEVR